MHQTGTTPGLRALRAALLAVLAEDARLALAAPLGPSAPAAPGAMPPRERWLRSDLDTGLGAGPLGSPAVAGSGARLGDADLATSSHDDEAEGRRLIALVELARGGDKEAFGQLYDHYQTSVYRFVYYRVGSVALAEDLTGETFFRALRGMSGFRWQGKDFGAWLMTIARNLTTDHFKAGRTRLEQTTEDMGTLDSATEGPELEVLASLTNETLMKALTDLPTEQRECLVMRFLQGLSIAETADLLGRSSGAVKQLQLRGVRNLAKALPDDLAQQ